MHVLIAPTPHLFVSFLDWFRAARGMELLAWMASMATLGLVVAYMFFLREIKYGFLQWIIIGLCFFSGEPRTDFRLPRFLALRHVI